MPLDVLDVWLSAGIRLVQLRAKRLTAGPMLDLADATAVRCRAARALFIVNDRADVAALAGASGVHVGQDDLTAADARSLVGPEAVVGVSTHTPDQLERALADPADYLAIGPAFPTTTKDSTWPVLGVAGVVDAVRRATGLRPVVAIGGITLETAPRLLEAGVASVAIISDLVAGEVAARAREYVRALH